MTTYFFILLKRIFTFFLLLNAGTALAQHQLNGTVHDEQNHPLPFANVLLLSATDSALVKGTVADTTGAYVLDVPTNNRYLLSIQMVGYTPLLLRSL